MYEIAVYKGKRYNLQRGMYASQGFSSGGMSSGGDFAQSFGICPRAHRPAVLWFYNRIFEPGTKTYDAVTYPHRAVYAFVNWPIGVRETDPNKGWPRIMHDQAAQYFLFRNGWRGDDDVIVTIIGGERRPFRKANVLALGQGQQASFPLTWPDITDAEVTSTEDNCHVLTITNGSFVVDFSGKCGVPTLLAAVGPGTEEKKRRRRRRGPAPVSVKVGKTTVTLLFLHADRRPEIKVEGNEILLGERSLRLDGTTLVPGPRRNR
jgi:hypothetical protein